MPEEPNIREMLQELLDRGRGGTALPPQTLPRLKSVITELQQVYALLEGQPMPEETSEPEAPESKKWGTALKVAKGASPLLTLALGGGVGSAVPALMKMATGYDLQITPDNAAALAGTVAGGAHVVIKHGASALRSIFKNKNKSKE